MRLCVIPARAGSKRILRKNIKLFNGKAIIAYSIEAAIQSACFDKIIVSTDDMEIAELAKKFGAEVPFFRPAELSNDYTGTLPVIKHAIEWFEENHQDFSAVCCIYATAPLLLAKSIQQAYALMLKSESDYCFSVSRFPFPIQRAIKKTANNRLQMFFPEHLNSRSQDLTQAYHDAGQFYWGKPEAFKQQKPLFSESATAYILPGHLVQDIDTPEDWLRAELMYEVIQQTEKI